MNRSELEALIAQTMQKPHNAPLSPKQQFQSQVRGLSGRPRHAQIQPESSVASVSRRHELHHVSTLRVQHKRNASATPSTRRAALSETSHNLQRSQMAASTDSVVPDFSAEEREAWSKKSPGLTSTSTRSRHGHRTSSPPRQQTVLQHQPLLFPPPERLEPILQPRKQARQPSSRQFEALQTEADLERPKTSRGPPPQSPERTQHPANAREQEAEMKQQSYGDARSRPNRPSKFLEGSMNDRSVGVASSWYHDNTSGSEGFDESTASLVHDTDTDSDATPRASKPLPRTPAPPTTKKSIFRFGGGRSSEESARSVEEVPKNTKERKGLRKSISIWNFQALGDKIFGGSTHDAASETSIDTITDKRGVQEDRKIGNVADIDILNERKRKAEEAYAQQFGLKKQKSNLGQSVASTPAAVLTNETVIEDKRPKTPTLFRRKRDQRTAGDQRRAAEALDAHKRLSRRDLEKENQQLRTMLRESQSMTSSRSASLNSLDLQPKGQENFIRGPIVMLSPGKKQGRMGEDIPPVPKLPDQGVLAEMQNRNVLLRARLGTEKEKQGSFETIEEGEEGVESGKSDGVLSIPAQWEWPEDVF
jgi:hypothetical protein